jgi:hypothetical protein
LTPIPTKTGNNRFWQLTSSTIDLIDRPNGDYELEVFFQNSFGGGDMFAFTAAGNPTATFTVTPEPSRAMLLLFWFAGVMMRRRR